MGGQRCRGVEGIARGSEGGGRGVLLKGDGAVQTDSADFRKGQSCNPHHSNAQLRPRERGREGEWEKERGRGVGSLTDGGRPRAEED